MDRNHAARNSAPLPLSAAHILLPSPSLSSPAPSPQLRSLSCTTSAAATPVPVPHHCLRCCDPPPPPPPPTPSPSISLLPFPFSDGPRLALNPVIPDDHFSSEMDTTTGGALRCRNQHLFLLQPAGQNAGTGPAQKLKTDETRCYERRGGSQ
ncbi:hypothetical protein CFC21_089358 [Triticum aestivum]|uniref:Uncharacterized 16 kDa protein in middle repetitive insertion sequence WIS1 n=2 Tax=Triticum aestivum TaxID=4565 RepID=YWIS_WHEAT|nr:RecName: Full=Uncharacterized 16 kDa protein in middle repetitive insertion sequence WIS1 [Triticum aestivum]KAF7085997.1 hypothetical protein CFC21_089358 [Triticum aestivum]CAA33880.1 unnamed protein product [Triticum aestivum]